MKVVTIYLLLIILIFFSKYYFTDGFLPSKIYYNAPFNSLYNIDKTGKESEFQKILNQRYFYIGKGRQCYAFESQDKQYVIKFIRYNKYRDPFFITILDYLNLLTPSQKNYLKEKRERYRKAINSYLIAYKQLGPITEVAYLHLNRTDHLRKKLNLTCKINKFSVDLDNVGFIIQRRASSLSDFLKENKSRKEIVFRVLDSFWETLLFKTKRGIVNVDTSNVIRNSGVLNNYYIETDIGSYNDFSNDKEKLRLCFYNYVEDVRKFLQTLNEQEYLTFFDKRFQSEIENLNL